MNLLKYRVLILLLVATTMRVVLYCNSSPNACLDSNKGGGKTVVNNEQGTSLEASLNKFRMEISQKTRKYLPSPHSELLLGMVMGIDDLKMNPTFNDVLKSTGTIHVVVVSGFNISLVFSLILKILGSKYKLKNLITAQIVTFIYAVITGFEPPVIRAFIMGSIVSWGKYYGRGADALPILIFSGIVMIFINPLFLFSLSFQLSFMATLSLLLYSEPISLFLAKIFKCKGFFIEDLGTTLAAQVLVTPLIAYYFGRVSLISPIVNALILWTVPISTMLGGVFIFSTYFGAFSARVVSLLVYPSLDVFVECIKFFGMYDFYTLNIKLSVALLALYYFCALLPLILKKV